ncbi:MAG: MBL fold metallo-hydrolase [Eubacteriales bacterium]|nr:MBL fold metallo-hydrolase [Eubacteriales bacterium]
MLGFAGCGAALYPELYNSNGYFVLDGDLFLIDCGETTFRQHYMAGNFDHVKSITVFITHMHTDHIGSLGTLIVYCYLKLGIRTRVIYPEPEKLETVFRLTGVEPEHYELYDDYAVCKDRRVGAVPIQVKHHDVMVNSFGYIFSVEKKVFYYSGDAAELPENVKEKFFRGEIDELYQDTSVEDHGGAHFTLQKLEEAIPLRYRSRVYCMHYDGEFFEIIRSKGFQTIEDRVVKTRE